VALSHSPSIVTNGLVLCLDAANRKGYDKFENLTPYSNEHTNSYWASPPNGGVNNLPTITLEGSNSLGNYYRWTKTSTPWITGFFGSHFPDVLSGSVTISFNIKWGGGITNLRWYGYNNVTGTCTNQIDINSSSGVDIGDGWRKVTMTFTATNSTNRWFIEITGTGYWLMQNIQSELGSTATDYYATTSTAKNRGTIWSDLSGRGNTGTLTNGVGYNNSNIGSFVFDGVDDYITCGNPSSLNFGTGNFTISFIVYTTAYGFQGGSYVGKGNGTTIGFDFRDGGFFLYGTTGLIAYKSFAATLNVWEHHTIVYDSSSSPYVKFYKNGTYTGGSTTNNAGNISSIDTSEPLRIGLSVAGGPTRYFNGRIPLVQAYNRALTAAEVQQNFNALRGRFGI